MSLDLFFQQFNKLSDTPNSVPKLRELILHLAVQGKLVSQHESDEPACNLIPRIEDEKQVVKNQGGVIKPQKSQPIQGTEIPYNIPSSWYWFRLADICYNWGQKTPDTTFTYVDVSSINKEKGVISEQVQVLKLDEAPSRARKLVRNGSVIYSTVRPYLLNVAVVDKDFDPEPIVSTAFAVLHPFTGIENRYLYYYLRSKPFIDYVASQMMGVAYPAINDANLYKGLVPVPPTHEQKRIVAKVEQLMQLCDQLEEQQQKRHELKISLNNASLDKLLTTTNPEEFNQHWNRITTHFDILYDTPTTFQSLKQSMLELAVLGSFTSRNNFKDVTSYDIGTGKISIPDHWQLFTIEDSCTHIVDCLHSTPKFTESGFICIDTTCISPGKINFDKIRYVSESTFNERRRRLVPQEGDILFSREGTIGVSVIVPPGLDLCLGQRMMMFRVQESVNNKYFTYALSSPFFQKQLFAKVTGTASPHVNIGDIRKMKIPLPPVKEQKEIVNKLESLVQYFDSLITILKHSDEKSKLLLNSLIDALLKPANIKYSTFERQVASVAFVTQQFEEDDSYIGITKLHKAQFLLQEHCRLPIEFNFKKRAAGPHDTAIYPAQNQAASNGWIDLDVRHNTNPPTYHYSPYENIDEGLAVFQTLIDEQDNEQEVVGLMQLLKPLNWKQIEAVATVYACWQEAMAEQEPITEQNLSKRFYDWHENKQKNFTEPEIVDAINWIKAHQIIPHTPRTYERAS